MCILICMRIHKERKDRLQRLVEHVEFNECWEWRGIITNKGYGKLRVERKWKKAHVYSYEIFVGQVPEDKVLDHLCRNPGCVNPEHLEPVTNRINILRGISPAAQFAKRTHCPKNHELTHPNIYLRKGARTCKRCKKQYSQEYYKRRRNAELHNLYT